MFLRQGCWHPEPDFMCAAGSSRILLDLVRFDDGDMVTERTRNYVWQALLDLERLVRYYAALSDQHRKRHSVVRFLLLASAAGGVGAFLTRVPEIVQLFASVVIALIVVWDAAYEPARKGAVLHAVSIECNALGIELQALWLETDDPEASDNAIRRKGKQLERRILEVTSWAGNADVRENPKLNEECEATAYRVLADRYAG